jgi:tRNA (Thr-GGU) A37 N-methylase
MKFDYMDEIKILDEFDHIFIINHVHEFQQ